MKRFNSIILFSITLFTLFSCGGITNTLSTGQFSKNNSYNVKSYFGCCGCEAKYLLLKKGNRKTEQIIYSYNCYAKGNPTKFIFNYNKSGKIISCEKYIATNSSEYTIKLSEEEKQIFRTIDTSLLMRANSTKLKLSDITGFRKPLEKEITHSFPLVRRGFKIPIL